ncbi:MAG TPA: 3-oxoadipyl-CoA thiolase [Steroidobacteraceae bacterium]|nr:3-oxoadipyl-CoA thiolase [Steroidobacteraceae bacterium]
MNGIPVFVCAAARTPFGRYGGALAGVRTDDLAALAVKAVLERSGPALDPAAIDDVVFGCANQAGEDNRDVARMALLLAGLPVSVPGVTLNRLCGSGLDAVGYAARAIASGEAGIVMAGGVESMTRSPFVMSKSASAWGRSAQLEDTTLGWRLVNPAMRARYGVDSMPETAENVARDFHISRDDQDAFALRSQQKCAAAQAAGSFAAELVTVQLPLPKGATREFAADEHPRADTSLAALAKLKPVVSESGSVTAGNAAGINDGSCALLLASEEAARRHGLVPRARILGCAVAGVEPRVMGMGPVPATRRLLRQLGLALHDFACIELNEAFAAQALAVLRELKVSDDDPRVNPNGGAIAIGHPLGASGARLVTTAVSQLVRTGQQRALATMCIGVGQGIALALERV